MPGIVGFFGPAFGEGNRAALGEMVASMLHEPFYRSGTIVFEDLRLWFGWVVQGDSYADCMPIWNETRDICLLFSGEHLCDPSELARLKELGHAFASEKAGALVHLYEEHGIDFLARLNGCFHGIVIDLRSKTAFLFNDRFGSERLYVHEDERGLFFASEAKALLKVIPGLRRFNHQSLGEFISCSAVLENRTLFQGVYLLPTGSCWALSGDAGTKKSRYFEPKMWEQSPILAENEYYVRLREVWTQSIQKYFKGGSRTGLSLTGGIDSRMILAAAHLTPGELPCYTFGGRYRDSNDVKLARQIAAICGQPHHVLGVEEEFLANYSSLAEKAVWISDGAMDVTGSVDLYVQRKARQLAPTRITGTCGGEILRRLVAFKPIGIDSRLFDSELGGNIARSATTYAQQRATHPLSFTAFQQTSWHMASKFSIERSQVALRMPYFDNDVVALSYQAPPSLAKSDVTALALIAEKNPRLAATGTDRGADAKHVTLGKLFSRAIKEFAFKAEYYYDYGMPNWLANVDRVLSPLHLERLILGRHKFHHFRVYYKNELSEYVSDMLIGGRVSSNSYVNKDRLNRIVEGHLSGAGNYTWEMHKLLTMELIERKLLAFN
jgi:asparagine synthase (glutamine-hydrolysing)